MKRFSIIMLFILLFLLMGCTADENDSGEVKIVATNFAMYDFSREIAGDLASVHMLLSPGSDAHDIEATLEDVALISTADVIVSVGGEDEEWLDDVLNSMGDEAEKIKIIRALDCVTLLDVPEDLNTSAEHGHGDEDHEHGGSCTVDEHVWTSPKNAVLIADRIRGVLIDSLPEKRDEIEENYAGLKEKLNSLDSELRELAESADRKTIVVADRFPFLYLTSEYGITAHAAFSGCSSKTEPSLAVISSLIDTVKGENLSVIFTIEFSDGVTARAVAEETGVQILTLHSAHNVDKREFESGITYTDIMKRNIEVLRTALCD